jgi:structural toxin protein (hemagglutinin/hemolysin) RtxA
MPDQHTSSYYHIVVYVPEDHIEDMKSALFEAGAGQLGHYRHCAWQCLGQGQFLPDQQANPSIGKHETLTYVNEYRLEVLCQKSLYKNVISALKMAHPYEEPAFLVYDLIEPRGI